MKEVNKDKSERIKRVLRRIIIAIICLLIYNCNISEVYMEYLDIVDENNEFTGIVEERKKAHEMNLWHRHVTSWIMNTKGEILLQKRAASKPRNPNRRLCFARR